VLENTPPGGSPNAHAINNRELAATAPPLHLFPSWCECHDSPESVDVYIVLVADWQGLHPAIAITRSPSADILIELQHVLGAEVRIHVPFENLA
jgi:hypothetical protein